MKRDNLYLLFSALIFVVLYTAETNSRFEQLEKRLKVVQERIDATERTWQSININTDTAEIESIYVESDPIKGK